MIHRFRKSLCGSYSKHVVAATVMVLLLLDISPAEARRRKGRGNPRNEAVDGILKKLDEWNVAFNNWRPMGVAGAFITNGRRIKQCQMAFQTERNKERYFIIDLSKMNTRSVWVDQEKITTFIISNKDSRKKNPIVSRIAKKRPKPDSIWNFMIYDGKDQTVRINRAQELVDGFKKAIKLCGGKNPKRVAKPK